MHILEAGHDEGHRPTVVLLHGFPELAYCWRSMLPILADHGFHAIAPDQRGYGRTSPGPTDFEADLEDYAISNLASDIVGLVGALGLASVEAVIGHDFGSVVAGYCALARPDVFRRLVLLGTPFNGAPALGAPLGGAFTADLIHQALSELSPPRKHYQYYYSGPDANHDMWKCPQGIHQFLRGYYHQKSADWPFNDPRPLKSWTAEELARMPSYYCMPKDAGMAQVAASSMPTPADVERCSWLTEGDLALVAAEFDRTGFQGALHWYRSAASGSLQRNLALLAGRRVEVPTLFAAGKGDWGTFQVPGALDAMRLGLADKPIPVHLIDGAGHWIQQEQPRRLGDILLSFLRSDADDR